MVPPAGFDGIGHQFGGDVGVFFHAGHAFLVGQLHGAQAVGSHFGKKLVGGAAAVIMQPGPQNKFSHRHRPFTVPKTGGGAAARLLAAR